MHLTRHMRACTPDTPCRRHKSRTYTAYKVRRRVRPLHINSRVAHLTHAIPRALGHRQSSRTHTYICIYIHVHFTYSRRNSRLNNYDPLDLWVICWSHSRRRPVVGTKMCWKSQYFNLCLLLVFAWYDTRSRHRLKILTFPTHFGPNHRSPS